MPTFKLRLLLGLVLVVPSVNLSAQDVPPVDDNSTIVVTGQEEADRDALREAVRDIAKRGRSTDHPSPKYHVPLCVSVAGLGEEPSKLVKQRIEANTSDTGFEVAEPADCDVNALVVVVDDQLALIDRLRKSQPNLFTANIERHIKASVKRNDAAISWAAYRLGSPQAKPLSSPGSYAGAGVAGRETVFSNAGEGYAQTDSRGLSRSKLPFSSEKVFSVVVFDIRRLIGLHLDQVADYATMQILADPQPNVERSESSAGSILSLFAGNLDDAPLSLTDIDRAFLRGLAVMRPSDPANRLESFVLAAYEDLDGERDAEAPTLSDPGQP